VLSKLQSYFAAAQNAAKNFTENFVCFIAMNTACENVCIYYDEQFENDK